MILKEGRGTVPPRERRRPSRPTPAQVQRRKGGSRQNTIRNTRDSLAKQLASYPSGGGPVWEPADIKRARRSRPGMPAAALNTPRAQEWQNRQARNDSGSWLKELAMAAAAVGMVGEKVVDAVTGVPSLIRNPDSPLAWAGVIPGMGPGFRAAKKFQDINDIARSSATKRPWKELSERLRSDFTDLVYRHGTVADMEAELAKRPLGDLTFAEAVADSRSMFHGTDTAPYLNMTKFPSVRGSPAFAGTLKAAYERTRNANSPVLYPIHARAPKPEEELAKDIGGQIEGTWPYVPPNFGDSAGNWASSYWRRYPEWHQIQREKDPDLVRAVERLADDLRVYPHVNSLEDVGSISYVLRNRGVGQTWPRARAAAGLAGRVPLDQAVDELWDFLSMSGLEPTDPTFDAFLQHLGSAWYHTTPPALKPLHESLRARARKGGL